MAKKNDAKEAETLVTHGVVYARKRLGSISTQCEEALNLLKPFDGHWPERSTETILDGSVDSIEEWKMYDNYPFENLVFSAGGAKGISYLGAVAALEETGILSRVTRFAGCSVGSMTATLLAIGCPAQEMLEFGSFHNKAFKYLLEDQCCPLLCLGPKLIRKFGLHPMKRFYKHLGKVMEKKVGNKDITFGELYRRFGRELVIVATNLSAMRAEYFGKDTTPNMKIREAIRMSISIPGAYEPHIRTVGNQKMYYVDGAMLNDYPLHAFDDADKPNTSRSSNIHRDQTLGFYLFAETICARKMWKERYGHDAKEPSKPTYTPYTSLFKKTLHHEYCRKAQQDPKLKRAQVEPRVKNPLLRQYSHFQVSCKDNIEITGIAQYMDVVINTMIAHQRGPDCRSDDISRTVPINCGYLTGLETEVETEDLKFLIDQGYEKTRQFLMDYVARGDHSRSASRLNSAVFDSVFENLEEECEDEEEPPKSGGFESLFSIQDDERSPLLDLDGMSLEDATKRRRSLFSQKGNHVSTDLLG